MEQHHYNTYSSTYHSNAKRKLYLGLNRHGLPRKIQLPATRQLGKLATYTKSLTQTVAHDRVEKLIARLFGANHVRHGLKQLCDTGKVLPELVARGLKKPKCNGLAKPNRKKKKKRRCREDEPESDLCTKATSMNSQQQNVTKLNSSITNLNNKKKVSNGNQNPQPKRCGSNEDCSTQKPGKKKPTKKNNQHKPSPSSGNKPKPKKKPIKIQPKTTLITTTPPKPDEEIDPDIGKDEAFTSDELELEEEDYDDMNVSAGGHSINLVDDHEHDDYNL